MAHSDSSNEQPIGGLARVGGLLHRYFLPTLLAVYVLAGVAPGPGTVIREFSVALPGGGHERASMLLLAALLFCAAAVIEWSQVRELVEHPSILLAGLLACWFGPVILTIAAGALLPRFMGQDVTQGLLVGLALVAAMPVANSSAGWTQNARGNVTLSLGLIVLSILLSPLATPNLLKLMGMVLSDADTERVETIVTQFSGWSFILWVILPSIAGAVAAWTLGARRIERLKPYLRLTSLLVILILNYANASAAVRTLWEDEQSGVVLLAGLLAVSVCLVGIVLAALTALAFRLSQSTATALAFSLSMKHTGLALVLAGKFLPGQPRVMLVILLSTLAQHLAAAAVDWRLQVRGQELGGRC